MGIAIDEYLDVWMNPQTHLFADIGLNRYFDEGRGRPKETETGHFDFILNRFAARHGISAQELEQAYDGGKIQDSELDRYFVHDRAMRESGHDTTTRLDDVCADTACVDLNAILYRVETDIAALLDDYYPQGFTRNGEVHTAAGWQEKAQARRCGTKNTAPSTITTSRAAARTILSPPPICSRCGRGCAAANRRKKPSKASFPHSCAAAASPPPPR